MKVPKILTIKRYIVYPAIVGFITLQFLGMLEGTSFGNLFIESGPLALVEQHIGIPMPFDSIKYYYAYAVGFSYGTLSSIIAIHKMKLGLVGIVIAYLKYGLCFFMMASLTMFWIPVELLLLGSLYLFKCLFNHSSKKDKKIYQAVVTGI